MNLIQNEFGAWIIEGIPIIFAHSKEALELFIKNAPQLNTQSNAYRLIKMGQAVIVEDLAEYAHLSPAVKNFYRSADLKLPTKDTEHKQLGLSFLLSIEAKKFQGTALENLVNLMTEQILHTDQRLNGVENG